MTSTANRVLLIRPAVSLALAVSAALASGLVAPRVAHAAPPAAEDTLEEVVITAEKRTSTVQSTAISITAVTGEQLIARGVSSVVDLAAITPGISMRTAGPGQTELEIRGLSSSGGASPTVGFYLDEVPLSPAAASLNGRVVIVRTCTTSAVSRCSAARRALCTARGRWAAPSN